MASLVEQMIQTESQNQAADQVSVGNSITSLRFLDVMDWREFVETLSIVEQTLRNDPADIYSDMDFGTRDAYRHVAELIAAIALKSEWKSQALPSTWRVIKIGDGEKRQSHARRLLSAR